VDGWTILRRVRSEAPSTDIVFITAYGTISDAVAAMKEQAFDYLAKPFEPDELVLLVTRLAEKRRLLAELESTRSQLRVLSAGPRLVGRSPAMVRVQELIQLVARHDAAVLLTGESGTGKDLAAHAIHDCSSRSEKPFVAVNCAAFPDTLLEAELFGHQKGSFTGAVRNREGRLRAAHEGTLFLDEIGEMTLAAQAKLLRVLQDGVFEPIGSDTPIKVDVRFISATNQDLKRCIAEGRFREDLYYRIKVLEVQLPPLRERRGDLPMLVEDIMRRLCPDEEDPPPISPAAWAVLRGHRWPGNVRELKHALEHARVLAGDGEIDLFHLPPDLRGKIAIVPQASGKLRPLGEAIREFEREYLIWALRYACGNRTRAAELLGISRKGLWEKLKGHSILDQDIGDGGPTRKG
jgi:DNA-binding NtrC family response regulator